MTVGLPVSPRPLVTVIIATYNRRHFLAQAIDSVLAQTYQPLELIVIDDGSVDGTAEMIQERYQDRVHYAYQENQGRSAARNHGLRLARGRYIAFLDSDDLWKPEKIERQVAFMEHHPEYGLTHAFSEVVNQNGMFDAAQTHLREALYSQALKRGYSYEAMSQQCIMFLSTVMLRAELLPNIGGMDEHIVAFEDWDWYLRLSLHTRIGTLEECLVRYRIHDDNSTQEEFTAGRTALVHKHLTLRQQWPAEHCKQIERNFYLQLADIAYKQHDKDICRHWMFKALRIDPLCCLRAENWRYTLTTVFPDSLMRRIRHFKRRLQTR